MAPPPSISTQDAPFDLHASLQDYIVVVTSSMIGLSVGAVILRFISRKIARIPLLWDDWLIVGAIVFNVVTGSINIKGAKLDNFGTHILATATRDSIIEFLKGLWVFQLTYTWSMGLAKLSIVALYWRVFSSQNLRIPLILTAGVVVAWIISVSLAAIFSCVPVQAFWMFDTPNPRCINSQAYFIGSACPNIATDIALLIMPLFMVRRLNVSLSQRIAVCVIFGLGIFGTICSGLRLYEQTRVFGLGLHNDPTWDLVGGGIWSIIEVSVCIICACLGGMRPLLRLVLHGKVGSAHRPGGSGPRFNRTIGSASVNGRKRSSWVRYFGKVDYFSDDETELTASISSDHLESGPDAHTRDNITALPDWEHNYLAGDKQVWVRKDIVVERSLKTPDTIEDNLIPPKAAVWRDGTSYSYPNKGVRSSWYKESAVEEIATRDTTGGGDNTERSYIYFNGKSQASIRNMTAPISPELNKPF